MKNFLEELKEKISEELDIEEILLIDNSHLHVKHKSFISNKFYPGILE